MFSKEESQRMRQEFWTSFGKSFPRKWTLYNTKIKGFSFKFYFDTKKAMVLVEIDGNFELENGKEVSCVFVEKQGVCIHNRNTWQETMEFLSEKMNKLEEFWQEYQDFFKEE